ncbi:OmpA family protein [Runella zeae]|uniref:OmpA family protein n=1 Tax=Runella zeae TaxID=94255 RepID=UPI00048D6D5E|nr:OmpA family protein [Runella zeae]
MRTVGKIALGLALTLLTLNAFAQTARLRSANRAFDDYSYSDAVRGYEEFLRTDKKSDPVERKEALEKLAYSYRRLQDTRNAERIYSELVANYNDADSRNYLYYAQALASNGKYRESQKMYSKYAELQSADLRGRKFTVTYMDMNRFYKDSAMYRVEYLPINSRQADFSPMYYKGGLVFVSSRAESGVIKRVFNWNQTPFLDLYFTPDTSALKGVREVYRTNTASLSGGSANGGSSGALSNDAMAGASEDLPLPKTKAEKFSRTLNTKYHEGPASFFKDFSKVVFTRNNYNSGKARKSNDGVNKLKLFIADQKGKDWGNVKELPFNNNDFSCGHPALSPDDSKLYFVSDMPGGYGGTDVYVVEYNNGQWGTPVNLGKEVNTEGNEMFPFIDSSGNLYFASDGHEGLGGLDIFFAELKDGIAYKGVQNLGAPINSEKDDFGLITDHDRGTGYFSSNRVKGVSDDNIYSFKRTCRPLEILVLDAKTGSPIEGADVRIVKNGSNQDIQQTGIDGATKICLEAQTEYDFKAIKEGYATNNVLFSTLTQSSKPQMSVSIYLNKSEATILRGTVKREVNQAPQEGVKVTLRDQKTGQEKTVVTGSDGGYEFEVDPNRNYDLRAEGQDLATNEQTIGKNKKNKRKVVESDLSMYGTGDVFTLDNIYYDLDKFFIRPEAARELDKVVALMKKYPQMKIELRSFTDSRASDTYNLRLSERRARAAFDYLVRKGITPARLEARGYGESELVNDCIDGAQCDEADHRLNRRTEFKILSVRPEGGQELSSN